MAVLGGIPPMNACLLTWVLCATVGSGSAAVTEQVDLIELNHFHDADGEHRFDQLIFYRWHPRMGVYHVHAWRLINPEKRPAPSPSMRPMTRLGRTGYECVWHDGDLLRYVWSPSMRETWTQYDPERVNTLRLPKEHRSDLARAPSTQRRAYAGPAGPNPPTRAAQGNAATRR
jgi:hypothetical protein